MTVHSAKGLEFPVVFLPGMEKHFFRAWRAYMYRRSGGRNAVWRMLPSRVQKEELYISARGIPAIFGMTNRNRVSRFVEEIPETLVEHTRSRDYSARPVSMPSFGGAKPFGEAPKTKSVAEAGGSRRSRA